MPRSKELLRLGRNLTSENADFKAFRTRLENDRKFVIDLQTQNGIEIITSGELERDNYVSFVGQILNGAVMMNMSDMLDFIDDKMAFENILQILDVPSFAIKNAICNGELKYQNLVTDEIKMSQKFSTAPLKATLPGIYLLTRSMWLSPLSSPSYTSKEELAKAILAVLKREIDELVLLGVSVIQFDEPVLSEVAFAPQSTRSFMCASLSSRGGVEEEMRFATALIKQIFDYLRDKPVLGGLHVCRGNWSKDESILLSGSYEPLRGLFGEVLPDILFLEYSIDRAGEIEAINDRAIFDNGVILGLGVINPRSDEVESVEKIKNLTHKAMKFLPSEQIWLNPDCGFATFANRALNSYEIIAQKLANLNQAKAELRAEIGA